MNISYDAEANAAYLSLTEDATVARTIEVTSSVLLDVDSSANPLGLELLFPARQLPLNELQRHVKPAEMKQFRELWNQLRSVLNKVEDKKRTNSK